MKKVDNYYNRIELIKKFKEDSDNSTFTAEDAYKEYFLKRCLPNIIRRRLASVCNLSAEKIGFPIMDRLSMLMGVGVKSIDDDYPMFKIQEGQVFWNPAIILSVNNAYYDELVNLIEQFNDKYDLGVVREGIDDVDAAFSPSTATFGEFVDAYNQEISDVFGDEKDEFLIDIDEEKRKIARYGEAVLSDKISHTILDIFIGEIIPEYINTALIKMVMKKEVDEKTKMLFLLGFGREKKEEWSSGYYHLDLNEKTFLINIDNDFQHTVKDIIKDLLKAYGISYKTAYSELKISASLEQLLNMYYMEMQKLDYYLDDEVKTLTKKS